MSDLRSPPRRLAVVWFADIVAYSRLASTDEDRALHQVHLFRRLARECIEARGGRLVHFIGDGALAEFASAAAAARAALSLREAFARESADAGSDSMLRIGLHLGEVVPTDDGDLYGDGVNTAARLETAAEPGQVLASEGVWRQLRHRPEFGFQARGERTLKGLAAPERVFALGPEREPAENGKRSEEPPLSGPDPAAEMPARRRMLALLAAGLVALIGYSIYSQFAWPGERSAVEPVAPEATTAAIAVLPFGGTAAGGDRGGSDAAASLHRDFGEFLELFPGIRAVDGGSLLEGRNAASVPLHDVLAAARASGIGYVAASQIIRAEDGPRVSVDLYDTASGKRAYRGMGGGADEDLADAVGRLALETARALAAREGVRLGVPEYVVGATTSPVALAHLLRGQDRFWMRDFDGAAAAFRRAIAADSACGLAYHRLSVVEVWRRDYPAALAAVEAGLALRERLSPRWIWLLEAQRQYVLRNVDAAIDEFQDLVKVHPAVIDAWLGLAESLYHFGPFAGRDPAGAEPAFERVASMDSAFAPIYKHLTELALYRGDAEGARRSLARMRTDAPWYRVGEAALTLRFGGPEARAKIHQQLQKADRSTISLLVAHFARGGLNLPLVDALGTYLMRGPGRTPDDRLRGAQYRLVALAGQGRWAEAVAVWNSAAAGQKFDRWMIQADLAGYPAGEYTAPMFAWARSLVADGHAPDFTQPMWDESRQAFRALVHRATLEGDSAGVHGLLARLDAAAAAADPSDPEPMILRASLRARLALLAADTAEAIRLLERSLERVMKPSLTAFLPLTVMAPQRLLLAELELAQGNQRDADRWLDSFSYTYSIGDAFYAARVANMRTRGARSGAE